MVCKAKEKEVKQKDKRGPDSYFYEILVQNGPNHYECAA
jgi:hypothetical protein